MKTTFYILFIFTLFVSIATASKGGWWKQYSSFEESQLYMILTKGFDVRQAELHSRDSVEFVSDSKNIKAVQGVLEDIGKSPFDLYNILIETLQPGFAELSKDYYKEQRDSSGVSNEFNEFDVKFYYRLGFITRSLNAGVDWDLLEGQSSKEEVMCEAAYFYGLIDFECAITCLDAAPLTPLTCGTFSNFVADMYFGEALRPDFSYESDVETRKWLDDMVEYYRGGYHRHTTSLMRRFTRNTRDKVDDRLWKDYMRAMMTVHLSAALLEIKVGDLKYLYDYLADNRIQDEYMFASEECDPLQPGETVRRGHGFLRTFKLDPSGETATMGIINSGAGLQFHDSKSFNLSELPDTISKDPRDISVTRYIPFVVYDALPKSEWEPAYTSVDSLDKAYFEHKQKKHEFGDYKKWQYIDDQRAGTCTAMSLWSALYWFERESQQRLESFRLALYLEVLKEAAKKLFDLRTILEQFDDKIFEMADDNPKRNELQLAIKGRSDLEDDYLRFFSVGFNSAIRSIRYLHYDPFNQGLNMTSVMQDYASFYESQASEKYWQFVKPNIDDLYNSTYDRILKPEIPLSIPTIPKISTKEYDCVNEVNQAITAKDPFNFVKAVINGTDLKCQSKAFLASIHFGVDGFNLQTHHQDLILRALAKEIRSLSGGKLPILRLVHKLINDYSFKLFPIYDIPSTERIDFTRNIYQVVLLNNDTEMKQFAVNCTAFDLVGKNVLAAAYELILTLKSLTGLKKFVYLEDTEEFKLFKNIIQHVATELQSMDPHLYAQYLASLIWNAEQTGSIEHFEHFRPSKGWNQDDYDLFRNAAQKNMQHMRLIERYIECSINYGYGLRFASSHPHVPIPSNLSVEEYACAGNVSHAINMNSPLDFIKAVVSEMRRECRSGLFFFSITHGIKSLELQVWHRDLILRAFAMHSYDAQTIKFINKLITEYGFKFFSTNDTPRTGTMGFVDFFDQVPKLTNDTEAQQLIANLREALLPAVRLLSSPFVKRESLKLRSNLVDRVFTELRSMNPHIYAYYLGILICWNVLEAKDFASTAFKPSEEWNHYDYILIDYSITADRQAEFDKIFAFPKEYQIDTKNVRDASEFDRMGLNPSQETLKDYATMLFTKGRKTK